jgi:GR25 family glycosyltransferase involved in LPS biosynthesis
MQNDWNGIFQLIRVDGVKSSKKYAGCALAHINAIRRGLQHADYCIVLEDDIMPDGIEQKIITFIESIQHLFPVLDAISLCPTFDRALSTSDYFFTAGDLLVINTTGLVSGAAGMIYTRRILRCLDQYETHVLNSPWIVPNDRLFSTSSFGFFQYSPLQVGIPKEYMCRLSDTSNESDNFSGGSDVNKEKLLQLVNHSESMNIQFKHSTKDFYLLPKTSIVLLLSLLLAILLYSLNWIFQL